MLFALAARPSQDLVTSTKVHKAYAISSLNNLQIWLQERHKRGEQANSHPMIADPDWYFNVMQLTPTAYSLIVCTNGDSTGEVVNKQEALEMLKEFRESVTEQLDYEIADALLS
jgi:hypothetical protein